MFEQIIQVQTKVGTPVEIHGSADSRLIVSPLSKAITLHLPLVTGVWNRPVAIELHDGQKQQRLPILDITRIVQLGLLGLSLIFSSVTLLQFIFKREA